MFQGEELSNILINKDLYKDCYIICQKEGQMELSKWIEIEVIYTKKPEIRRWLVLEAYDNISLLHNKILEVFQVYPKLSGLNGLSVKNLKKKTEKDSEEIKLVGSIGENFKSKDIIYFDLDFSEIWLDIRMILQCQSKIEVKFELKFVLGTEQKEFEETLVHIGISTWEICNQKNENDYYSYNKLVVNYPGKKEDNKFLINPIYDYDSELTFELTFTNITDIVSEKAYSNKTEFVKLSNERKMLNNFIKENLPREIVQHNCVIWKKPPEENYYTLENSNTSLSDSQLSYKSLITSDKRIEDDELAICNRDSYSGTLNLTGGAEKEKKKEREKMLFEYIELFPLIAPCTKEFMSLSDFENKTPDIRSIIFVNQDGFEADDSHMRKHYNKIDEENRLLYYKNIKLVCFIFIFIFILTLIIKIIK